MTKVFPTPVASPDELRVLVVRRGEEQQNGNPHDLASSHAFIRPILVRIKVLSAVPLPYGAFKGLIDLTAPQVRSLTEFIPAVYSELENRWRQLVQGRGAAEVHPEGLESVEAVKLQDRRLAHGLDIVLTRNQAKARTELPVRIQFKKERRKGAIVVSLPSLASLATAIAGALSKDNLCKMPTCSEMLEERAAFVAAYALVQRQLHI